MKTYKQKIIELMTINSNSISTKEIEGCNISRKYLTQLVNEGFITRIGRGKYILSDNLFIDDLYNTIIKSKNAVYSHTTALYLHNLSDRIPLKYDITVQSGYNGSLQKNANVNLFYTKKSILYLGLIEMNSPFGSQIRVYDKERTICDIIKNRNKMDKEIFAKALKWYIDSNERDFVKLFDYAEKLKIKQKVLEYMEVLL